MNTPSSRTALVTGGAKRLGRLLSLALAEDGWDIALHCNRSRAEAETVCEEICNLGQRCTIHTADLRDDDDFVDQRRRRFLKRRTEIQQEEAVRKQSA